MNIFRFRSVSMVFLLSFIVFLISIVGGCKQVDSPIEISNKFWTAVQERDMESAKIVATWDTVDYLRYLNSNQLHPERFELGEQMMGESRAEVETILFTSKLGEKGVKLPGITVLVKTDNIWRVDVKKSMASVIKYSTNNVLDQLNGLMQNGIKGLDDSFSEAMNELGSALEESAEELKRELSKPIFTPNKK